MCHTACKRSSKIGPNGGVVINFQTRIVSYLCISSLIGLTIGAFVSLAANVFVNGIKYFEALRLTLLSRFFFDYSEYIIPFAWLTVGFFLVFLVKKTGCTSGKDPQTRFIALIDQTEIWTYVKDLGLCWRRLRH